MAGVANFYSPAVVNGMLYNIGVPVKILQISQDQDEQGGQEQPQAEAGGCGGYSELVLMSSMARGYTSCLNTQGRHLHSEGRDESRGV